jgi:hypothetical protein
VVNLGELVFSIIAEDKASTTVGAAAAKIGQSMAVAGAAITAFGAGATLLIDRNREMDASFRTTALSAGLPAESIKELARSLQSVDSPIAEVSASLDILARAGMDNVDSMGQTASAFDTLADGIGVNADTLTDAMVPAFAARNIELEDAPQYVDGLATTFRTANVDLADFSQLMTRVGPDLGEMGLGLQDVETILMALAEKGITGRKAMSELSKAIEESGGSSAALYRSLGITNAELGTYNTKLANSTGAAQEFADAQNSAFGTVDKLGFELDKLGQSAGDMLAPFEGVATACIAVGPAMTAAGSAASLLDNEMMMKLFPSLGKVVTGITGAGGLVPALGAFTTSLGLTSAGLTTFATAAAAIAVPLVALVATCALLGPAIDAAGQAWIGFLGATKDTTAAVAGVEEQYDETTGAVIRYADAQTEATMIAADAAVTYDEFGTIITESAAGLSTAAQEYDEFGNAIETTNGSVAAAVPIYDEFGVQVGEMVPNIRDADTAAADATVSFDEWGNAIGEIPGQMDGVASSVGKLADSMQEWADSYGAWTDSVRNGTAESPMEKTAREQAGMDVGEVTPRNVKMGESWSKDVEGSKEAYIKAHPSANLKPDSPDKSSSGSGSGSTEPTWAGKGDLDYTGGDPNAWKNDPRLNGQGAASTREYVEAVKTVAPATNEADAATGRFNTTVSQTESTTRAVAPAVVTEAQAVGTLTTATTAAVPGLTYFRDAQGQLTDMVLQAPVPLQTEATAMSATATAAAAAGPSILALERATLATATAATAVTPAATGAGIAFAGSGASADIAAKKVDAASLAYNAAKMAADEAAQKVLASKTALDAAAGAANANAAQVEAARRAYDNAKQAAADASKMVDESGRALARAKQEAAQANSVLGTTATNMNTLKTSAVNAGSAFVSMGKQYLTARNSIQSNPITSIHTIKTIVEGGGANVAPGASATKYYPGQQSVLSKEQATIKKFHSGGTFEAPSGQSEGFAKLLDGERVLSRAETREYEGGGIAAAVAAGIAKGLSAIGLGSGGGDVIVHGDVKLSEDYSYDRFREDVGRWKDARIAKGVL